MSCRYIKNSQNTTRITNYYSSHHLQILKVKKSLHNFFLKFQDTKSSNGTFVNNKKLVPEKEHHEVNSGDILQFGVDVLENNRKVTHGCIIATLKLYLPDGKETSPSTSEISRQGNVFSFLNSTVLLLGPNKTQ